MRIVIDLQGAQTESRFRGIGRYSLSLAKAIIANRGDHEVLVVLSELFPETIEPIRSALDGLLPQHCIRIWAAAGPVHYRSPDNQWRRAAAERIREAFLASLLPDVVLVSSFFEGYVDDAVTSIGAFAPGLPTVVILYDLIPLLSPAKYLDPNPVYAEYYRAKLAQVSKASRLLGISESSCNEAKEHLGLSHNQVVLVSGGVSERFHQFEIPENDRRDFLARLGIERGFALYTGGSDERKNLPRLIKAWASLPIRTRNAHQLVLAGRMPDEDTRTLRAVAREEGVTDGELVLTGFVSDQDLLWLYNLCTAFVFPSWHEGLGLPPLEAMACGAPVIAAGTSALPEVVGRADALFDPVDTASITSLISRVLEDTDFRQSLSAHGKVQAAKFQWSDCGRRAVAALEELLVDRGPPPEYASQVASEGAVVDALIYSIATSRGGRPTNADLHATAAAVAWNHRAARQPTLFVDVSELVHRDAGTGIQRVTRSFLKGLLDSPPGGYRVEPVYAVPGQAGYRYARQFTLGFTGAPPIAVVDEHIDCSRLDVFLGLDLQHRIAVEQAPFLSRMRDRGMRVFFVVYDLLPITHPEYFPPGLAGWHQQWLATIAGFDGLVCISRAVADRAAGWLDEHGPRRYRPLEIGFAHLGADVAASKPSRGIPVNGAAILAALAGRPSFLMVGTLEPRKGHREVLDAFDSLWGRGIDLCLAIVGRKGWHVEALAERISSHPEIGKRLFWLQDISDEFLERIYQAVDCLIAASEDEGFGLPLVEAAQKRVPLIARDIAVFREVAGPHAAYFGSDGEGPLADKLVAWLELKARGDHPRSDEMPWLTWKQSTEALKRIVFEGGSQLLWAGPKRETQP